MHLIPYCPLRSLSLAALLLGVGFGLDRAHAQLLDWKFNEGSGETVSSSGSAGSAPLTIRLDKLQTSLFSPDGGGASGKPGDYALDFSSASGMGANTPPNSGPVASAPGNAEGLTALSGLDSFTITGWLKPGVPLTGAARIIVGKTFYVHAGSSGELQLGVVPDNGTPVFVNSDPSYTEVGMWMFFAITYDGTRTMDNVNFYVSLTDGGLNLVCTRSLDAGKLPPFSGGLDVGNVSSGVRPFQGMIDNLAIYGAENGPEGALPQAKIEEIYNQVAKP